mmetsp:Transcript_4396/g.7452  ORF Transcript_4396/g.7452 Transcript_4396/m.7452 type:complete len:269 (-) Transcript_4396:333-1139(-)
MQKGMDQDEETRHKFKLSKFVSELDEELRDRFKALKSLQDLLQEADEEEQKQIRQFELEYEKKYQEIYNTREEVINGKIDLPAALVTDFDERAAKVQDEDYEKVEVTPCDVKQIQNMPKGICDFWLKAMVNHPMGVLISEKDRPILGYLVNIQLELHSEEKGDGFDLIFTFSPNSYFEGTEIKAELYKKDGMQDRKLCSEIKWKDACNPTLKKQKKKKKGKKVTVEVKQDSFFNFFTTIDPTADDKEPKKEKPEKEEDEDEADDDENM